MHAAQIVRSSRAIRRYATAISSAAKPSSIAPPKAERQSIAPGTDSDGTKHGSPSQSTAVKQTPKRIRYTAGQRLIRAAFVRCTIAAAASPVERTPGPEG